MDTSEGLNWLNQQQEAMEATLCTWCNSNSGTFNSAGVRRQAVAAANILRGIGAVPRLVEPAEFANESRTGVLGPAVLAGKRLDSKFRILLCIHTDTVYAPDHPFQSVSKPSTDHWIGPGVADAKGGLIVLLWALNTFESHPLARALGWEVLLTPDEENGSLDSQEITKTVSSRHHIGLLFEPAEYDGTMISERSGSAVYEVVVSGREAHIGRNIRDGRNAITALASIICRIDSLSKDPNLTDTAINVGLASGGRATNIVPANAQLKVGIRMWTPNQHNFFRDQVETICREVDVEHSTATKLSGGIDAPAKPMTSDTKDLIERVQRSADRLKIPCKWGRSMGVTDGNIMSSKGLPNLDTFGVRGGSLHSDREFIVPTSLSERAKLVFLTLVDLAEANHK